MMMNTTTNMELISTHPVKKSDLGFHGNLFGGKLLAWVDAAGAAYASQVCDTPRMVTVLIDECVFQKPAKEGHLLKIYGEVEGIGNSSVTLKVEARSHNVYDGRQAIILSTRIKFVRIDEQGDAIPISERVKNKYLKHEFKKN
ncbi:hydrolase/thioesterase [Flavobacterium phage vB_FspM_immuto_2-6A]|uniref:Hydrolase/thioesterase n=1 Tax=Flavobacterium phage vB_FspM_immuto_2-6A TaxID=2801477 RepID=A0A7T8IX40_9CAUD|nr:hydrolase/thioesterase [Flavobacterium phage vB_FspM_immuto_2-6A]QQO91729.1 hydrolase/thioesterase [Flavobacterium phage vB_FspM_immuto_2-6A]